MAEDLSDEIRKHLEDPVTKSNYDKAILAYFMDTQEGLRLRIDYLDITNLELNCHDENSGEEYAIDLITEQGLKFYTLEEL